MKSSELAKLAGVSVRTLRHYHAIGLLPEPPRQENGYRDYGADELVRLLRIKRLAALGFSLSSIGDVLDEMDESLAHAVEPRADDALEELDHELAMQIERLEEQRRTIALLKSEQLDPELPVRFARTVKALMDVTRSPSPIVVSDHAALLIAGHLYSDDDISELERLATALEKRDLMEPMAALQKRVDELAADASQEEQDDILNEAVTLLSPLIDCFSPTNWEGEYTQGELLMREALYKGLNVAQASVSDRLEEALAERILERTAEPSTSSP